MHLSSRLPMHILLIKGIDAGAYSSCKDGQAYIEFYDIHQGSIGHGRPMQSVVIYQRLDSHLDPLRLQASIVHTVKQFCINTWLNASAGIRGAGILPYVIANMPDHARRRTHACTDIDGRSTQACISLAMWFTGRQDY